MTFQKEVWRKESGDFELLWGERFYVWDFMFGVQSNSLSQADLYSWVCTRLVCGCEGS